MLPDFDSYGLRKRFDFICKCIRDSKPTTVLDFGCGAGTYVTLPLAREFPDIDFLGVDADVETIHFASKSHQLDNLRFDKISRDLELRRFDMIIASEVLEHVDDPSAFLGMLASRVRKGGSVLITVPNGYGPFELGSFLESVLHLSRVLALLSRIRHLGKSRQKGSIRMPDTLAVSPHINFFSWWGLRRLYRGVGFRVERYRPRTFLCGFIFDQLLRGSFLLSWNARVADVLPPWMVSDWMFLIAVDGHPTGEKEARGTYAVVRGWLNRKRAGLL